MFRRILLAVSLASALTSLPLHAQQAPAAVDGAWARATVQGQTAGGAFMRITAREHLMLVGVESPVAGQSDVHEMKLEGDVIKGTHSG